MPDYRNRSEREKKLARELARLFSSFVAHLMELFGETPDLSDIPQEAFDGLTEAERAVLLPFFEQVALDSAEQMIETIPLGVDWGLVNQNAISWARQYTYDLVRGIDDTSRQLLRDKIGAFYDTEMTLGDLRASLTNAFGPVRADMIATTETTRAAVQGEMTIVRELERQGVVMVAVWQTNNDERVCPICGPNHGQPRGTTWIDPPPAHPRCRCWINHEFITEDNQAMIANG